MDDKENMSIDDFLSEKDRTDLTHSVNTMFFLGNDVVWSDDFPPRTTSECDEDPRLNKIKKICEDAFNNPDTQDIDKYRAQALANIYAIFLYGDNAP